VRISPRRPERGRPPGAAQGASSLRRETLAALGDLGLKPRRRLGQSFLVDAGIAERIVSAAEVEDRTVLEIGPGLGALSGLLARRARRLVLVEIDPAMASRLEERFATAGNVTVLAADALTVDFERLSLGQERAVVVSNLPYRTGSRILLRLLEEGRRFVRIVAMLQREVAERLTASPGDDSYGLPTVWTKIYADARCLFRVPPRAFVPRPRVESAVVQLDLLPQPRIEASRLEALRRVARAAFGQRRKMLRRALAGLVSPAAFERAGVDPSRRGETLDLEELARLASSFEATMATERTEPSGQRRGS
jgi:16S rRNA (adenine1518-N6/adenine1519-N6)-dimethyltransferase